MITVTNEPFSSDEKHLIDTSCRSHDTVVKKPLAATTLDPEIANQLLFSSTLTIHHLKAGLNPLVDSAAYLFSLLGKLQLATTQLSDNLRDDLIAEINTFQ